MKKFLCLKMLTVICLLSFTACQKTSTEEVSVNNTATDEKGKEETNQVEEDSVVEGVTQTPEPTEVPFTFEPTITNPESLFENIELATGYKKIENKNPLISHKFGADPFAMVYGDRVYVYMTSDGDGLVYDENGVAPECDYGKINSLVCISSDDLVNWTDHGKITVGGAGGITIWARNSWAPSAVYKKINGKDQFFLYYANGAGGIGVLRSDSPYGPFQDPLAKPLITRETENCSDIVWLFDPSAFVDEDGQGYLYFGGGVPEGKAEYPNTTRVVKLGDDMISLAGTPEVIEAPFMFEDSGMNKIGDTYYYSYCSSWSGRETAVGNIKPGSAEIVYMTSKSPMGPWEYKGSILQNPGKFFGLYGNNHHCITNFKDQWYIFYHSMYLGNDMRLKGYRSTHVDKVTVNEDGTFQSTIATKTGVDQLANFDPYKVTEAETMAWQGGIARKKIKDESVTYGKVNGALYELTTGDWIGLSNVDFGDKGPATFTARVSSEVAGNVIKICADDANGEVIGYYEVPKTENADTFVEVTVDVNKITGVHNLFFVFSGEGFAFDSWKFNQ